LKKKKKKKNGKELDAMTLFIHGSGADCFCAFLCNCW